MEAPMNFDDLLTFLNRIRVEVLDLPPLADFVTVEPGVDAVEAFLASGDPALSSGGRRVQVGVLLFIFSRHSDLTRAASMPEFIQAGPRSVGMPLAIAKLIHAYRGYTGYHGKDAVFKGLREH